MEAAEQYGEENETTFRKRKIKKAERRVRKGDIRTEGFAAQRKPLNPRPEIDQMQKATGEKAYAKILFEQESHTGTMAEKRIRRLPSIVIDRIAAGEVIESPSSVVKELAENALDAGATRLRVETAGGGLDLLVVEDNGSGIVFDELPDAIERHATSKIGSLEDIESILSYGFRGEALASIASVSLLEIQSRPPDEAVGGVLESRAGTVTRHERSAGGPGTVIRVRDLFFATPARKKFIKSEKAENLKIFRELRKIALASPGIEIHYVRDGQEHLHYPARASLKERILDVFPGEAADRWLPVEAAHDGVQLSGFISTPDAVRSNRDNQLTFVNGRCIEFKYLSYLLKKGYGDLIPHGMHPSAVLFFTIPPDLIDVNVHPAKKEIRFLDENRIQGLTIRAVQRALSSGPVIFSQQTLDRNFKEVPGPRVSEPASWNSGEARSEEISLLEPARHIRVEETHSAAIELRRDPQKPVIDLPHFLRQMGVIFGTYILAEAEDGLYLIDQHTAHERVNYEKKRRQLAELRGKRQPLLHAAVVRLSPDEMHAMETHGGALLEAGFLVEPIGRDSCAVREVPAYMDAGEEGDVLRHTLQRVLDGEQTIHIFDEYAAMKACKASIKRNDSVGGHVLADILKDLMECDDPTRCPHGRPTMVKISREAMDRLFMRS